MLVLSQVFSNPIRSAPTYGHLHKVLPVASTHSMKVPISSRIRKPIIMRSSSAYTGRMGLY
jgi:hypothetical protein